MTAAALIAVDVMIPWVTHSSLIATKDQTLTSVVTSLQTRPAFSLQTLSSLTSQNPLASEIGWSQVTTAGIAKVVVTPPGHAAANPAIGSTPATEEPVTVPDAAGASTRYRTLAVAVNDDGHPEPAGYLVAWMPLDDVADTIGRLVLLEVLISLGLLILVGLTASLVIRRELKPLEAMAHAADEIAGGDLDARVDPGAPGTEVGRLGIAFNGMLDGIQGLLDERDADEERLRRFIADASHELRTPVAAIRGYTDLYRAGALPDEVAVDRAMDRMGFESRRMGALVEDLLTLIQADARPPRTGSASTSRTCSPGWSTTRRSSTAVGYGGWPEPALPPWCSVTGCGCTSCSRTCWPTSARTPRRVPRPPCRCIPPGTRSPSWSATTGRASATTTSPSCSTGSSGSIRRVAARRAEPVSGCPSWRPSFAPTAGSSGRRTPRAAGSP